VQVRPWKAPTATNSSRIAIFSTTMELLARADCRIPTTSSIDVAATMKIAGRLTMPASDPNGGLARESGMWIPASPRKLTA
jgi:hypothetical protein